MLDFPNFSFPPSVVVLFSLILAVLLKKYEESNKLLSVVDINSSVIFSLSFHQNLQEEVKELAIISSNWLILIQTEYLLAHAEIKSFAF